MKNALKELSFGAFFIFFQILSTRYYFVKISLTYENFTHWDKL